MVTLHPIVAQMTPSDEQRPAVVARGRDVAVTAGAGAGKTRTLVARYLSLLAEGLPLRAIVAITFTRKAAREMRNRVRKEMGDYLARGDLTDAERALWHDHYQALDGARIGTIHSLCGEILRRHPAALGIDPRFTLLDEGQMALLQAQAVEAALAWAADQDDLVPLFGLFGEQKLTDHVVSLLRARLDVEEGPAASYGLDATQDLWALWAPHLVGSLRAFLDDSEVQADVAALLALRANGTLARAQAAGDALTPDLEVALAHIDAIAAARAVGNWIEVSRHLQPLRAHLLLKGRQGNWDPARPKDTIRSLRERYEADLQPLVGDGIDLELDRRLAQEVVPGLMRIHGHAVSAYDRAKRRRQALDFDDLEHLALDLLRHDAEARAMWQEEVAALLVDEFQDTNGRQRDLMRLLNGDRGRLFIVGDGKQSIYAFRGADVSVFRDERRAIEAAGERHRLATSYRAHRDLVRALNALLRPVLGDVDDPDRPYVEPFAPLAHAREAPVEGLEPPHVELILAVGDRDRAVQRLCERLAELVESRSVLLEAEDEVGGGSMRRPLNYGDIAILCRASTSFPAYEAALEAAGIPYLTIAGRGFYDRPEVRDLVNALTALADPSDDLALAGLLRSPAVGLSDMALYRLRALQRDADLPSLWRALRGAAPADLADEIDVARQAVTVIDELHDMVGRTPVADVLKAFLDRTAYRAMLLRAGERRAAGNVNKLLADAQAAVIVGVDAFLAYLEELRDVAPREGEARVPATGAVQIMTVHQAKGLEFPVVVLGDASRRSPGSRGLLIDAELGVVPPLSGDREIEMEGGSREVEKSQSMAYRLAAQRQGDREAAEADRLLYVAATRAREVLWVNGTVTARKDGSLGLAGWLEQLDRALHLSEDAPPCDSAGDVLHEYHLQVEGCVVRCTICEPAAALGEISVAPEVAPEHALPADLRLLSGVEPRPLRVDEAVSDAERDPPPRVWQVVAERRRARAPAWVVGEVVHQALAAWIFPEHGYDDFARQAVAVTQHAGLTDEARAADAVRRAARMLDRFCATELYTRMGTAEQRLAEVPYSVVDGEGRPDSGVIDALWKAEGRWHLVEFKTDRVRDEAELDALLHESDYVNQVARYVDAAERLLGQRPEPVLCFLNVAGRVRLVADRWAKVVR